jgi:hypothetical protein
MARPQTPWPLHREELKLKQKQSMALISRREEMLIFSRPNPPIKGLITPE